MSYVHPFCEQIRLYVKGRIPIEDARRQEMTARDILSRLRSQPGVILADEVGMGKTFVALAVAVSVALSNQQRPSVVIMVPPSLREKWPADFDLFREKCLPPEVADRMSYGFADRAEQFLKFLDDPPERQKAILFVTHGAMSRTLTDSWVMLALIQQALKGRWGVNRLRRTLSRCLGRLLRMQWAEKNGPGIWEDLLRTPPSHWLRLLRRWNVDPEGDSNASTDDDPVPEAVWRVLPELDTDPVFESLKKLPRYRSRYWALHTDRARQTIREELRTLWGECIRSLQLRLPLLILDEAHHLKNPRTQLASLFQVPEAEEDAGELTRGALAGAFERMLFLTATPFQLGHAELCSVLERFEGIAWRSPRAPTCGGQGFRRQVRELRASLDAAQESAVTLDSAWGLLRSEDLSTDGELCQDVETWWPRAQTASSLTPAAKQVLRCYQRARDHLKAAEGLLRPWVIRHLKPRQLPQPNNTVDRRRRFLGEAITTNSSGEKASGIAVSGKALLPFLLAARATSLTPDSRPVFAEGLASSYEAFLQTRASNQVPSGGELVSGVDADDVVAETPQVTDATRWYLEHLEGMVSKGGARAPVPHPKVSATVGRVVETWRTGEKALVFCHWVATGRTLRQRISEAIDEQIKLLAAVQLDCSPSEAAGNLERIGRRFLDEDSPVRRCCESETAKVIRKFTGLHEHEEDLIEVVRRNARTPSFLVRFFPLERSREGARLTDDLMVEAMDRRDGAGVNLRDLLEQFLGFLADQCGRQDRVRYIEAMKRIQTGSYYGVDVRRAFAPDELQGDRPERLVPNVRLVNGDTKQDTRQRLMLAFNTPFAPDVLVASSVMAEGVDLHLSCRYVIHHDLCWNPSTLEQRTGRIDRIGAKCEHCGQPIHLYLPYVAETQDEKMYRVVMDRERWFGVVMGEKYRFDARTTEKLASRIPLPKAAAEELAFRLEVV